MSVLGDFRRLDVGALEEIRAVPKEAYVRCIRIPPPYRLDLDRAWSPLRRMMDVAGFSLNPITAGSFFPDEDTAFGQDLDSRSLTPDQVAEAAVELRRTPFHVLGRHLRPVLESEVRFATPGSLSVELEQVIRNNLAAHYEALVDFFAVAAEEGQCTIFWAA